MMLSLLLIQIQYYSNPLDVAQEQEGDVCDAPSFEAGQYVLCRPGADQGDEPFWIGQVQAHRPGAAEAVDNHAKISWLELTGHKKDGIPKYRLCYRSVPGRGRTGVAKKRVVAVDWVDKASVQCNVLLTNAGYLYQKSWNLINDYVLKVWERDDPDSSDSSD